MLITVNGKQHNIPFHLSDITLGQFIDYYNKFGRGLDEQLQEIVDKDYVKALTEKGIINITEDDIELHKNIDVDNHIDNEALAWYSFWTGHDLFEVKDEPFVVPVLSQYRVLKYLLHEGEEQAKNFPIEVEWNDETWCIQHYAVSPASDMSANEVFTSKEVLLQVHNLGLSRWDALVYLSGVFFRKKGEKFKQELVMEGSPRLELMKTLPMEHAMKVYFFLNFSVSIWRSTLASSMGKAA